MKKILYTLLSISVLLVSLAIAGCGSDGDKYLGTWVIKGTDGSFSYSVISKSDIKDAYIITDYEFSINSMDKLYNHSTSASIKNNILEDSDGLHYTLKDNKLITNNGHSIYTKVSDKSMTLDEIKSNANTN